MKNKNIIKDEDISSIFKEKSILLQQLSTDSLNAPGKPYTNTTKEMSILTHLALDKMADDIFKYIFLN